MGRGTADRGGEGKQGRVREQPRKGQRPAWISDEPRGKRKEWVWGVTAYRKALAKVCTVLSDQGIPGSVGMRKGIINLQ